MASSDVSALALIVLLCISSVSPILACGSCPTTPVRPPKHKTPTVKPPIGGLPPVVVPVPPVTIPPVGGLPPVGKLPPVGGLPPIGKLPPVGGLPPVGTLPPLPPVGGVLPPVTIPPVTKPEPKPCAPPPAPVKPKPAKCPLNILKLGACANLLGGAIHIRLGDPVSTKCCPVLKGVTDLEAAACLCTALKVKLLNIKLVTPITLEVLLSCGRKLPARYTCPK